MTDDGTFVALARFESEEAARRNSERSEQDQWWRETAKLYTGDVTFHDCPEVVQMGSGVGRRRLRPSDRGSHQGHRAVAADERALGVHGK